MGDKMDLLRGSTQGNDERDPSTVEAQVVVDFIGEALDDDDKINCLMSTTKPEITVLVGFVGYGKTSFVASCYHKLKEAGKIGDYTFYDSDTLTGFERRIYLRRITPYYDDITPTTKRTIRGEPHLLTFRFSHPNYGDKVVVMSDHSGEDYADYRNRKSLLEHDILLKNADRIIFFVDCEKLVKNQRLGMQNEYTQLIQNMLDTSSFKEGVKIQFIFNKVDLTEGNEAKYHTEREKFMSRMRELLEIPIQESVEVVSNQVDNDALECLLLDIVSNTKPVIPNGSDFSQLDWTKSIF